MAESSTIVRKSGVPRWPFILVAMAILSLVLVDVLLRVLVPGSGALQRVVDIQSPATLYAKLDEVRGFRGIRVVLLGDSLVFGRTMRDHGDHDWQKHTLDAQLQQFLRQRFPDRPVMAINLGMNGVLPTDLDQLVRIIAPLKPDLVVLDVSLRAFSRDFDAQDQQQTRPWLTSMRLTPEGRYAAAAGSADVDGRLHDIAVNDWLLYRLRDIVRSVLFDGEPGKLVLALRGQLDNWLKTGRFAAAPQADGAFDDIVLLMRARARYDGIDLAADNPQRQAIERTLQYLSKAGQKTLVFYATENPDVLADLMDADKAKALRSELAQIVTSRLPPNSAYIGPQDIFRPENFLDHVHLTEEGYRMLTGQIGPRAEALIAQ